MGIIYEPDGRAGEYAPLAVNLYGGCDHHCTYCFGPSTLRKKREIFHTVCRPAKDALIRLAKDAEKLGKAGDEREILLSFVTDPYQTIENDLRITRQAIEILIKNNLRFTILTKGGPTAARDFDLLKNYDKASFGSTICFTKQEDADKWEPNAPEIDMRIETIKAAHEMGIRTWVSLEPVIDTDQALELIGEIHPFVDHWKVGKLNYKKLEVNWLKFRDEVTALFVSKGAKYYLKKSLRDIKEPKKNNPPKSVSIAGNGNRKSKEDEEAGPWTEGDIPTRKGNRSILVIAPHGHPGDDKGTYQLARRLADELNCYAVVNKKYRKPKNAGLKAPSLRDCAADLNCWSHVNKFKKLQKDFREPIQKYKDEIIAEHNALLILHIHGIGNDNRKRVAKLLPEFKDRPADLHLLIGYGQHRDNDKTLITANVDKLVKPLMTELHKSGVKSAIAPTQHIFDKNDEKQWYCGNHKKKLNQKLCNPKDKVQSLQLEFKDAGFRDKSEDIKKAALKFAKAVKAVLEVEDKDQNQNAAVPETAASKKHKIYTDFMAIIQRNSESAMLEAGQFLFNTFYKNEIEAAKDDKKKEPLNSLHEYIQDLHGNDPVAPKKSWIYNSVKLAVEYKELKAYLKDDFHMYGNGLNLSQKVLLFTENDLEKKIQIIRETAAFIEKSGKPLTFVEFKNRFDASRSKQKRNGTRNPSLLSLIGNPEKLIATEISKLLTPESLQKRNLPELKKLHSRASDCISAIQEKIEIQTEYLTRYKEISETLEKAAKDKAGKSQIKAQPELKTVTPV